jgi:poly(ribitol-phosphate) beta-N-acetylglucosaminyltransferase
VKVSVIVPVYNPGSYLEDCIGSLLRQTMPAQEFEAIFVDDGSTDGSPARLDALAAEYPHLKVIHQENSGWSGKPRNVGLDAARGEYVFFADNDDWLGDEALERMYTYAKDNDSDIVVGKMAGKGRGVPRELFRKSYPRASLANAPLIDSLTPHKMFRTAFLAEHKLRFPEEKRRLEDHVFVTAAFFAASTISVLSDYICYYHVRRDDSSNAGFDRIEPKSYFANLAEAIDLVDANTEPGPLRDRLHRRWYRVEMIERLRGRRFLELRRLERQQLLTEIRRLVSDRFGPGVASGLPPIQRAVGRLAQAARLNDLERLAGWEEQITAQSCLDNLGWHASVLHLGVTAELRAGRQPLHFVHHEGRDLLDLRTPTAAGRETISDDDLDATARLLKAKVDVLVRSRTSAAEYFLPVKASTTRQPVPGTTNRFGLQLHGQATLDLSTVAGGSALPDGIWDLIVRVTSCGWTKNARLGSTRGAAQHCLPAVLGDPARVVTPYWTDKHNLSLDIAQQTSRLDHNLAASQPPHVRSGTTGLTISIPLPAMASHTIHGGAIELVHQTTGEHLTAPAALMPAATNPAGHSILRAHIRRELDPGHWSIHVRLVDQQHGRFVTLPAILAAPADGGAPIIEAPTRPVRPKTPDEPPKP